jgi:hypothetical protein
MSGHAEIFSLNATGINVDVNLRSVGTGEGAKPSRKKLEGSLMTVTKSLLLGSAAVLVAVAGAQAADLPVKAKPVEYVKVCSLYGAGFFYMPGTDTCIKLGGYLRTQYDWGGAGDGLSYFQDANARETRTDTNQSSFRHRAVFTVDTRTQTEYGTLRSYMAFGGQQTTPNDTGISLFFNRAFIQFAGFTTGRAVSFYDFMSFDPYSYAHARLLSSTGASGLNVFAYTFQLGNGLSATISAEDGGSGTNGASGRKRLVVDTAVAGSFGPGVTTLDAAGNKMPDIVGALRIDQAWGSAQVMAAAHDASGGYYGSTDSTANGHPGDAMGWAVGAGLLLKNPLGLGQRDVFQTQFNYAEGAIGYVTTTNGGWQHYGSGNTLGFGTITDGVFGGSIGAGTASGIELTTGWGFGAAYQHYWNPKWKTSVYGGYTSIDYNSTATALICGSTALGTGVAVTNCNPDLSFWAVGTRTQWNPVRDLDVGVDVLYTKLNTAYAGAAVLGTNGARPAGPYVVEDQDDVTVMFRMQRNFLP